MCLRNVHNSQHEPFVYGNHTEKNGYCTVYPACLLTSGSDSSFFRCACNNNVILLHK